jgi:hypothetical protein
MEQDRREEKTMQYSKIRGTDRSTEIYCETKYLKEERKLRHHAVGGT